MHILNYIRAFKVYMMIRENRKNQIAPLLRHFCQRFWENVSSPSPPSPRSAAPYVISHSNNNNNNNKNAARALQCVSFAHFSYYGGYGTQITFSRIIDKDYLVVSISLPSSLVFQHKRKEFFPSVGVLVCLFRVTAFGSIKAVVLRVKNQVRQP